VEAPVPVDEEDDEEEVEEERFDLLWDFILAGLCCVSAAPEPPVPKAPDEPVPMDWVSPVEGVVPG
jgi:hypothetical protein